MVYSLYKRILEDFLMSEKETDVKVKFLHCSDIHLDMPIIGITPEKSDERKRVIRSAFMRLMEFVRQEAADFVLISGDLFDVGFVTNTTAEILIREFRNCSETQFIIAPGKHDPVRDNPIYKSGRLPENCHVFESEHLDRFDFPEKNVTVYGWAFETSELRTNPLYDRRVDDTSKINIVCGYGDLDGDVDSPLCPISTADIKKFGADYYALGSRHERCDFTQVEGSIYSYPGAVECVGFDQPGVGGVNRFTVGYKKGEISISVKKPVILGHLDFKEETLNVTGVDTNNEILSRVSRLISEKKYGQDTALRIILEGYVPPRFVIQNHLESDAFGLYYFEMIDKTLPLFGTERMARDMSVSGEIYRRLLPVMHSEDEETRLSAANAFRVALAALENRETDMF